MTPRARHRLGVILGAFASGVGAVSGRPSQPSLLGPAPAGQADTNGGVLAPASGWFGFVPARDKRLSRKDSKPLCATFECGQKLVLRRRGLMGGRPL